MMKTLALALFLMLSLSPLSARGDAHPSSHRENPSSFCYFTPPKGWEIADPRTLSPSVKIAFVKKGLKGFCPSLNLAVEEVNVSLTEYLKAIKAIHEQDRNNHWRSLGKVRTSAGLAQLTEIDTASECGAIRILQLILIHEGKSYVITAAALKEEFSTYYQEFQQAFRSLTLTSDLLSTVPQLERRELLQKMQRTLWNAWAETPDGTSFEEESFQAHHWQPFQKTIIENYEDMGAFWQVLMLKSTQEKLFDPH